MIGKKITKFRESIVLYFNHVTKAISILYIKGKQFIEFKVFDLVSQEENFSSFLFLVCLSVTILFYFFN